MLNTVGSQSNPAPLKVRSPERPTYGQRVHNFRPGGKAPATSLVIGGGTGKMPGMSQRGAKSDLRSFVKSAAGPRSLTTIFANLRLPSADAKACWEWTGPRTSDGYGMIRLNQNHYLRAHRISYELANGPIPGGLCVLHRCDNRLCLRPSHLFLGTRRQNALDKTIKGRVRQSRLGLPFGVAIMVKNRRHPYAAQIVENHKHTYLGCFATIEEAAAVAELARLQRNQRLRDTLA